ncbi:MAG TPA: hypothetical protein VGJ29_06490 [Vicinamibacterales bacterium]
MALLIAPRIIRLAHPQVWIEDESYLSGSLMLAQGFLPYRDFPLPHFPLLEAMLAAVFRVAGASIRSAEVFTQTAAFAGSLLVLALGRRIDGVVTGVAAALVFSTSALLFRYHLFEREVFVVVPVLAAVLLASRETGDRLESTKRAAAIGLLLFAALAIKLTAIAGLAAVALHLHIERRSRSAVIVLACALGALGAFAAILAAAFGTNFIVQVFLFRAVHAAFPSLGVKLDELRLTMDVSLAAGAAGIVLILWTGRTRQWKMILLQLGSGFVVLVLLNPTYWAHTGIELLPWLSLAAGFLIAHALPALVPGLRANRSTQRAPAIVCAFIAVLLITFVAPIENLNWQAGDGSPLGFGYRDRAELEKVGRYVRDHSAPEDLVVVPPMLAFVANRRELVPYLELAGLVDDLQEAVRSRGYLAALGDSNLRFGSFWEGVDASRAREAPRIATAIRQRRVRVVINDSPDDLMPFLLIDVPAATLVDSAYSLELATAHYDVWLRR